MTSVFQGLSLSRFVGRVGENPGNEVDNTTVKLFISNHAKCQECLVITYVRFQFNSPLIGKTDFCFLGRG